MSVPFVDLAGQYQAHLGHAPDDFPVTAGLGPKILSLPMFPEITAEQVETVVSALRAALRAPSVIISGYSERPNTLWKMKLIYAGTCRACCGTGA